MTPTLIASLFWNDNNFRDLTGAKSMRYLMAIYFVSLAGCSESSAVSESEQKTEVNQSEVDNLTSRQESKSAPEIVSLLNAHSVKRFLEAEFGVEFEKSTTGYSIDNESVEADIQAFDGELASIILQFKPLSEANIDKAILLTRKLLIAAGEDPREVENKIDRGRGGYAAESDGVEIKFAEGTYVRFSIWTGGKQDRAGVVIEPK